MINFVLKCVFQIKQPFPWKPCCSSCDVSPSVVLAPPPRLPCAIISVDSRVSAGSAVVHHSCQDWLRQVLILAKLRHAG